MNASIEIVIKHDFWENFKAALHSQNGVFPRSSWFYELDNPLQTPIKLERERRLIEEKTTAFITLMIERSDQFSRERQKRKQELMAEIDNWRRILKESTETSDIEWAQQELHSLEELYNREYNSPKRVRQNGLIKQRPIFDDYREALQKIINILIYLRRHYKTPSVLYEDYESHANYSPLSANSIFFILIDLLASYRYDALSLIGCNDFSIIEDLCLDLETGYEKPFVTSFNQNTKNCDFSKFYTVCHYYDAYSRNVLNASTNYVRQCVQGTNQQLNVDFLEDYHINNPLQEALMRLEATYLFYQEKDVCTEEDSMAIRGQFQHIYDILFNYLVSWSDLDIRIKNQVKALFFIEPIKEFLTQNGNVLPGYKCSPLINCPVNVYAEIVLAINETREADSGHNAANKDQPNLTEVARILVAADRLGYFPKKALDHNESTVKEEINSWLNEILRGEQFQIQSNKNFWSQTLQIARTDEKGKTNVSHIEVYRKRFEDAKNAFKDPDFDNQEEE